MPRVTLLVHSWFLCKSLSHEGHDDFAAIHHRTQNTRKLSMRFEGQKYFGAEGCDLNQANCPENRQQNFLI